MVFSFQNGEGFEAREKKMALIYLLLVHKMLATILGVTQDQEKATVPAPRSLQHRRCHNEDG